MSGFFCGSLIMGMVDRVVCWAGKLGRCFGRKSHRFGLYMVWKWVKMAQNFANGIMAGIGWLFFDFNMVVLGFDNLVGKGLGDWDVGIKVKKLGRLAGFLAWIFQ